MSRSLWLILKTADVRGDRLTVSGPKGHHLARVLRVRPGEAGVAVFGGKEHQFQVAEVDRGIVELRLVRERAVPAPAEHEVILLQALLPSADFDSVLEACTALGVSLFIPIAAERSQVRVKAERMDRWRAVIEAAAEQSHCYRLPEIVEPVAIGTLRDHLPANVLLLVLDPSAPVGLARLIEEASAGASAYALAVGPEGGWTSPELEQLSGLGGRPVSLGRRILRARLAPLAATAILSGRL